MRLLFVTARFPFGPGESFLTTEVTELERLGHELLIVPTLARGQVVHGDARPLLSRTRGAPVVSREIAASALRELTTRPRGAQQLADLRHSRSPLVLAKNLVVVPKGLWLARLARSLEIEHIHAHWAGTSSTIALIASAVTGIPWSLTVHRWDIRENNLLRQKVAEAAFVRAISEDGLHDLRRASGPTETPTVVIHMGVSLPMRSAQLMERSEGGPFRVLVPANLLEVKGHRHLIDAVALLRARNVPVAVGIAGQGPLRSEIEAQIRRLGLGSSCMFLGQLSHPELLGQLEAGSWDAVVLSSVETRDGQKEGIPVTFLEAMSYGIPVIGTAVGGIPELIKDGAGLLVPPADATALAAAIARLAADDGLRAQLSRAGRERVERDFAAPRIARELTTWFQRPTNGARDPTRTEARTSRRCGASPSSSCSGPAPDRR